MCSDMISHVLELGAIVFPGSQLRFSPDSLLHPPGSALIGTGHFRRLLLLDFSKTLRKADLVASLGAAVVTEEALSVASDSSFSIRVQINSIVFDNFVLSYLFFLDVLTISDYMREETMILFVLSCSNMVFFYSFHYLDSYSAFYAFQLVL